MTCTFLRHIKLKADGTPGRSSRRTIAGIRLLLKTLDFISIQEHLCPNIELISIFSNSILYRVHVPTREFEILL